MAKYETRIKAGFDHMSQYLENSVRRHYDIPVVINDIYENGVRIQIKFFDMQPPSHITILTGKDGEEYLYLEILESGYLGQRITVDDSGDRFGVRMQRIIDAYNPLAPEEKNSFSEQAAQMAVPDKNNNPAAERKSFFSKLFGKFI